MKIVFLSSTIAPCPTGTYYHVVADNCSECPIGTYQDEVGQFECKECPTDKSTLAIGSRNVTGCIGNVYQ